MKPRRDTQPVTIERLEHAKLLMAHIIDMDGDVYLPIFELLERELEEMKRVEGLRVRARDYLKANRHRL